MWPTLLLSVEAKKHGACGCMPSGLHSSEEEQGPPMTADRDSTGRDRMSSAPCGGLATIVWSRAASSLVFWAGKICSLDELAWTPFRHALD